MSDSISVPVPSGGIWDVVVVGGGPAGCAAAIAAAEEGCRVLLIERTCTAGGMGTVALVPAWCPFTDRKQRIHAGLAGRILDRSKAGTPHVPAGKDDWVAINAEHLKQVYDQALAEAGVEVAFDTLLVEARRQSDGTVDAIIVADKRGLRAIRATVFIDATGDGDLVARTGVAIHKGDDAGGELMPATMCFILANVTGSFAEYPSFTKPPAPGQPSAIARMRADPRFAAIPDEHIVGIRVGPGCMGFNAGHIYGVDNTDPGNLAKGMAAGRRLAKTYRDALAAHLPEFFADSFLVSTGSLLGTRETRRIVADYELTLADYCNRQSFPDEICRNAYFIDIHLYSAELTSANAGKGADWERRVHGRFEKYQPGESHGIPYRSLLPIGLKNVLVAGRCIGTDRPVNASVRVMPVCLCTGEAAGVAASAVRTHGDVRAVSTDHLRAELRRRGAFLP
ncbi:hypothetical protein LBMAG53_28350 [Planctomycetota bacterium]|nr:hypothetical protein LBMAG53_28350 [Planctomycetota bacterium]